MVMDIGLMRTNPETAIKVRHFRPRCQFLEFRGSSSPSSATSVSSKVVGFASRSSLALDVLPPTFCLYPATDCRLDLSL